MFGKLIKKYVLKKAKDYLIKKLLARKVKGIDKDTLSKAIDNDADYVSKLKDEELDKYLDKLISKKLGAVRPTEKVEHV